MKEEILEMGSSSKAIAIRRHRGIGVFDFILRLMAVIATLASAVAMATTEQTLSFFTQFIQFQAKYDDMPAFLFFVIANAIVSAYLVLSLPLSIVNILRGRGAAARIVLIFFDTAMMALLTAGASAAAAIVYLAHEGDDKTNWFAICQQFDSFCERSSGSLIGSFIAVVIFILLILMSGVAISRH